MKRCPTLITVLIALFFLSAGAASAAAPHYDLFLKSDYGKARIWLDTATGDFKWEDKDARLSIRGRGKLAFPNLGPIVFYFSGQLKGYDWVSISLKIYGRSATGFLTAFPEGNIARKVTSNFYDQNTGDDIPPPMKKVRPRKKVRPKKRIKKTKVPEVRGIHPNTPEIPSER